MTVLERGGWEELAELVRLKFRPPGVRKPLGPSAFRSDLPPKPL